MTATALNIASIVPAAQQGAGASANAAGADPVAGFEALLGALFPQTDPTATPPAPGLVAAMPGAPVIADPLVEEAKETVAADVTLEDAPVPATPTAGDAAASLAASLMAAQPAAVETPVTTAKDANATTAFGRDKAKGVPAFPALQNANPHARLAEKAELAVASADAGDVGTPAAETPVETAPAATATPAPQARNTAPPPAAAPTAPTAPPVDLQPDAAQVVAAAETSAEAAPAAASEAAVSSGLVPRADAPAVPAPAPNARAAKSERAKSATDASASESDDLKPLEAADRPVHAKAAQGVAKTASAAVEAAEAKPEETKAEPDAPEAPATGETRAASQAASPAHTSHGARGTPETVANLAAQIVKKLEGKSTRFDVELNPHGLGKVDVRIEIGAQGRITAGMVFENPQAAADVKARAAELQRALEQAGFDISGGISFDVAQDRGHQQQNQAWQDQSDASRAFQGRAFRAALDTAGDAAEAANQGALRLRRGVNSGLDLRI